MTKITNLNLIINVMRK